MPAFDSQALPFQIKVIEGELSVAILQDGQQPGVIQLIGRTAPGRGVKWGGKQRVQTTFYPGNPVGTQQVIGPTEDPTTVSGEWNDRYIGDGQALVLMEQLDQIRRAGVSVEVSWGGGLTGTTEAPALTGAPIVRVGIVTSFVADIDRVQDIRWEMEFTWRSRGQTPVPSISATGINPREGFGNVTDQLQLATSTLDAVRQGPQYAIGLPQGALDALSTAFEAVDTVMSTIERASANITSGVLIPASAAQQLIGACSTGVQAMITMETTLLGVPNLALEVRDSALDLIRLKDQNFQVLAQTDLAKETCVDAAAGMDQSISPDVIAEVQVPAGTDLRDLAFRYYGDPDLWWAIANENDIDGSAVPSPPSGPSDNPARPIRIPRPQPGASSDLRQQC